MRENERWRELLIDEDLDGTDLGNKVLDSFKSFLSAISNVEGIDSIVSKKEERGEEEEEYQYDSSVPAQMNVNFDLVYDILNGIIHF